MKTVKRIKAIKTKETIKTVKTMKSLLTTILTFIVIISFSININAFADEEITKTNEKVGFTDVKPKDWFYENVNKMTELGIVNGYDDGTFKPDKKLKFEEFLKLACESLSNAAILSSDNDVNWYDKYVSTAIGYELMDETYKDYIGTEVDRKTMAHIIYNVLVQNGELPNISEKELDALVEEFTDLTTDDKEVLYIAKAGIITGYPDGTFRPNGSLKRSEATTVIMRLIDKSLRKEMKVEIARTLEELSEPDLDYLRSIPTIYGSSVQEEQDFILSKRIDSTSVHEEVESIRNYLDIIVNRDYTKINEPITKKICLESHEELEPRSWTLRNWLLHYYNSWKEYCGVKYDFLRSDCKDDPEIYNSVGVFNWFEMFQDKYIQDNIDNKVVVEGKYYTADDMLIFSESGGYSARGILRFKFTSHLNRSNIKEELDLVARECMKEYITEASKDENTDWSIYMDYSEVPEFKVGVWYEIGLDTVTTVESPQSGYLEFIDKVSRRVQKYIRPIYIKELGK